MSNSLRRIWLQLTVDKRRFRAFVAVCGVGLVIWAKPMGLFLWARMRLITGIPKTAMADDPLDQPPIPALPQRPSGSDPIAVSLDDRLRRDPFAVDDAIYPKPIIPQDSTEDEGKSDARPADDPAEAEARLTERLRELVARFRLEAVISGSPLAVINGRTVQVGDHIPADDADGTEFRLNEVRSRSVVLECQGRQYELEMFKPLEMPD